MSKFSLFDENEYRTRLNYIEERLNKIDFSIIFNRSDLFYYSETGADGIITHSGGETKRFVKRNLKLARQESVLETDPMPSFRIFKELGKNNKVQRLGLELDLVPFKTVDYIQKAFNSPQIIDIGESLRKIRSIKSNKEQSYMKQAAEQTDDSFEFIQDQLKPGVTELEISAKIEEFLRRQGHPGYINVRMFQHNLTSPAYVMTGESISTLNTMFGPISGQGLCKLHKNGPSRRKIKSDSVVLIDTTGVVEGYTADETRCFFIGQQNTVLRDAYEFAKDIQQRIETILTPNRTASSVYWELMNMVSESEFSNNFMGIGDDTVSFIGHGIGLELDEFPIISDKYVGDLNEGNIIAMEPKLIFNKPNTGVGIEDSWIITKNKAEKITKFPW